MVSDPRTWTTLAYFILMMPLGTAYFTIAVTGVSTGLGLTVAPFFRLWEWLGDPDWMGEIQLGPSWLENPVGYAACGILGVLLLTGMMHLARGVGRMHARMAKSLLVTPA
ncbi:MAG TPA: sensor domain-containing protein, partial [Gammaproteobacteria bacterium]